MSSKVQVETDAVEVYDKLKDLSFKETKRAIRTALNRTAQKIVRDARTNLRKSFKNTNKVNPKYNDSLQKGIRKQRIKVEAHQVWTKVRAHSTNKHGSGSYRLPMLENGTVERYARTRNGKPLSKPAFRGSIVGAHFFKRSVDSNQQTMNNTLYAELDKAIDKINKKKLKKND